MQRISTCSHNFTRCNLLVNRGHQKKYDQQGRLHPGRSGLIIFKQRSGRNCLPYHLKKYRRHLLQDVIEMHQSTNKSPATGFDEEGKASASDLLPSMETATDLASRGQACHAIATRQISDVGRPLVIEATPRYLVCCCSP